MLAQSRCDSRVRPSTHLREGRLSFLMSDRRTQRHIPVAEEIFFGEIENENWRPENVRDVVGQCGQSECGSTGIGRSVICDGLLPSALRNTKPGSWEALSFKQSRRHLVSTQP